MPTGHRKSTTPWRQANQFFGIVLTIILLGLFLYIYSSSWAFNVQPDRFTLGFFPLLGVSWMLLAAVMMVFDTERYEQSGEFAEFGRSTILWVLGILLGWHLCTLTMIEIGFFPASFVYMCTLLRLGGLTSWRTIAGISAICVIVVFVLFRAIGIVLPMGTLWS